MKGIVFNLYQSVFIDKYGEDAWDELLDAVDIEGVYSTLGTYADGEFLKLVTATSERVSLTVPEIVQWFGRESIPMMAVQFPELFSAHSALRSFLLTLNDVIHPEVRKLYPEADVPVFDYDVSSPEVLVMSYQSSRKLCDFAIGLIEGAGRHFSEAVTIDHPICMNRGDAACEFRIQSRAAGYTR